MPLKLEKFCRASSLILCLGNHKQERGLLELGRVHVQEGSHKLIQGPCHMSEMGCCCCTRRAITNRASRPWRSCGRMQPAAVMSLTLMQRSDAQSLLSAVMYVPACMNLQTHGSGEMLVEVSLPKWLAIALNGSASSTPSCSSNRHLIDSCC